MCRPRIGPLLQHLCMGLSGKQLPVAARGLLAGGPGVRAATLEALPQTSSLSQGMCSPALPL